MKVDLDYDELELLIDSLRIHENQCANEFKKTYIGLLKDRILGREEFREGCAELFERFAALGEKLDNVRRSIT